MSPLKEDRESAGRVHSARLRTAGKEIEALAKNAHEQSTRKYACGVANTILMVAELNLAETRRAPHSKTLDGSPAPVLRVRSASGFLSPVQPQASTG